METKEFFLEVFGEQEGQVLLALPNSEGKPTNQHWFTYPEQEPQMREFVKDNWSLGVFFSPIVFRKNERTKESAISTQVISIDADMAEPGVFHITPSMIIETSPDSWHVYYFLDKPYDAHEVARVARRINQSHKEQGCDVQFQNAAKLMRVPGSKNTKHLNSLVTIRTAMENVRFKLTDFDEHYSAEEIPDAFETDTVLEFPEGLEYMVEDKATYYDLLDRVYPNTPLGESIGKLLQAKVKIRSGTEQGNRSETLYRLLCDLFRYGFEPVEAATLAWNAPAASKWHEDYRGIKGMWDVDLTKAYAEIKYEVEEIDPPDELKLDTRDSDAPKLYAQEEEYRFLTDEEEELLGSSLLDRWQAWAETKSDAISEYHRTACLMTMSTLYADYANATPKFGELSLNIYQMILGKTSEDRKTTAMKNGLRMLTALEKEKGQYKIPGNVSPVGLNLYMSENPSQSKVFTKDEVQGYFDEILNQQWVSNVKDMFNKLYDGSTDGQQRANKDNNVAATDDAIFSMYLNGIFTQTADLLTEEFFTSGFLMRFLYTVEQRPPGWIEPDLGYGKPEDKGNDVEWERLKKHFEDNMRFWKLQKAQNKNKRVPMYPQEESPGSSLAWQRLNDFKKHISKLAKSHRLSRLLVPAVTRMHINAIKIATIFAMDERSTVVKLQHVLQAIKFMEGRFRALVMVASQITGTSWERELDNAVEFIEHNGGRVTYKDLYLQFKSKRPREFEDMVSALFYSGRIGRQRSGHTEVLTLGYED